MSEPVIAALKWQAAGCRALGSAFSAGLLEHAAAALADGGPVTEAFAPWREAAAPAILADAAPLRWLGALHDIVLEDPDGPFADTYPHPDQPADSDRAWAAAQAVMSAAPGRINAFMRHEPQTNEVRRSAVLLPGFLTVAADIGLPQRVLELGASAGLNQLWDQRRYRLDGVADWGPSDAALELEIEWRGAHPPLGAAPNVIERAGCDRAPVDINHPIARRRLKACVWPDQFDRLARLDAAIAQTLAAGVRIDAEDAVTWAARQARPRAGVVTVVFHSVFIQYMPAQSRAELIANLAATGERARADAPLAWLRMEPAADNPAVMELRLTLWPGGSERRLATAHPHGAWIDWTG